MNLSDRSAIEALPYKDLLALIDKEGGQRAFARTSGIARTSIQGIIERARLDQFKHKPAKQPRIENLAKGERVRRWIVTGAQDETRLHDGFLTNLEALTEALSEEGRCEIMIAGHTYEKRLYEDHRKTEVIWADRIVPYMVNERVRLGDVVDFCGEMNTLPTAKTPLTGFETYTRHRWGVFPHAKVQLRSVPTMKHEPSKQIMTTGVCTLPNYVQKRAGIEATFHHVVGAVLIEIRSTGEFFCRHLLAEEDGSFYDLDRRVENGVVTTGHRIEVLNPGDIHVAQIDPVASKSIWGFWPEGEGKTRRWRYGSTEDTLIAKLRPRYQFLHDSADFQSRNSHNLNDPHQMFALFVQDSESVEEELREVAMFTSEAAERAHGGEGPDVCETVVVDSNHDGQLKRWLKTADYRYDPKNARFFLQCQLAQYESIESGLKDFSIFEAVMTTSFEEYSCAGVRFLKEDESFKVLGIEKGMHGHLGANGSRGSPHQFRRMGSKATTGHTHSCNIIDGIYTAGTTSKLDMGYNTGLSSWSHSLVVTYANGKRAILTLQNGRWAA